jgi:hypothetical protein
MAQQAYVFDAVLDDFRGVRRVVAVRADQTLDDLHRALQDAFGWSDDHLYSFWLSGEYLVRDKSQYMPLADGFVPGRETRAVRSSNSALADLEIEPGRRIAYLYDFGEQWKVALTLRAVEAVAERSYPRVVEGVGERPRRPAAVAGAARAA